jgi:hypothetical protein
MGRSSELYAAQQEREEAIREASQDLLNALYALNEALTATWKSPTDSDTMQDLGVLVCSAWAAAQYTLKQVRGR